MASINWWPFLILMFLVGLIGAEVLGHWEAMLTGLEGDRSTVADVIDWVAKERLVDAYAARHGVRPADNRLKALDLLLPHIVKAYADVAPGEGTNNVTYVSSAQPADARAASPRR